MFLTTTGKNIYIGHYFIHTCYFFCFIFFSFILSFLCAFVFFYLFCLALKAVYPPMVFFMGSMGPYYPSPGVLQWFLNDPDISRWDTSLWNFVPPQYPIGENSRRPPTDLPFTYKTHHKGLSSFHSLGLFPAWGSKTHHKGLSSFHRQGLNLTCKRRFNTGGRLSRSIVF